MGNRKKKRENIQLTVRKMERTTPPNDYLKYFKVVRYWAKRKYGLGIADLEMLMFLRSEHLFRKTDYNEFQNLFSFDKKRFDRLKRDGWIIKWRTEGADWNRCALYDLSPKGKRLCSDVYRKLNGQEDFSMDTRKNPVVKKSGSFQDKRMSEVMREINKKNQERRLQYVWPRKDGKR